MHLEDLFYEIASEQEKPAVIICDRGLLDNRAYCDPKVWNALLEELGMNMVQLRDKRYDAVVHLVTAADGAEKFYNLANEAWSETPEQARAVDKKLVKAWEGHQNHFIIDNSREGGFKAKMNWSVDVIMKTIGAPAASKYYKKFLLKRNSDGTYINGQYPVFEVETTCLTPTENSEDIRI